MIVELLSPTPTARPPPLAVRVAYPVLVRVTLQVGDTDELAASVIVQVAVPFAVPCGPTDAEKVVLALDGLFAEMPPVQPQE